MNDTTDTQAARLLDCGFCYEEQGEEVHPHPECRAGREPVPAGRDALRDRIAEARRDVHEALILLPAWEADRVRGLIVELEAAVRAGAAQPSSGPVHEFELRGDTEIRGAVLAEAIRRVADPAERVGLGWESARDVLRCMTAEAQQQTDTETPDLPARLEAVLTERFTELGNPHSRMRIKEEGPDGWPATWEVSPSNVADVLRELLTPAPASSRAAVEEPATEPRPVKPTVGYSGMGRVWCLRCTHPANENVPVNVDDLRPYEECAGCKRTVVDVARWMDERAASQPVQHAPGIAALCADCRAKGHAVCMPDEPQEAAPAVPQCDGCGHLVHRARKCPAVRYGERCECDEPIAVPGKEA